MGLTKICISVLGLLAFDLCEARSVRKHESSGVVAADGSIKIFDDDTDSKPKRMRDLSGIVAADGSINIADSISGSTPKPSTELAYHTFKSGETGITYHGNGFMLEVSGDKPAHTKVDVKPYAKDTLVREETNPHGYDVSWKVQTSSSLEPLRKTQTEAQIGEVINSLSFPRSPGHDDVDLVHRPSLTQNSRYDAKAQKHDAALQGHNDDLMPASVVRHNDADDHSNNSSVPPGNRQLVIRLAEFVKPMLSRFPLLSDVVHGTGALALDAVRSGAVAAASISKVFGTSKAVATDENKEKQASSVGTFLLIVCFVLVTVATITWTCQLARGGDQRGSSIRTMPRRSTLGTSRRKSKVRRDGPETNDRDGPDSPCNRLSPTSHRKSYGMSRLVFMEEEAESGRARPPSKTDNTRFGNLGMSPCSKITRQDSESTPTEGHVA